VDLSAAYRVVIARADFGQLSGLPVGARTIPPGTRSTESSAFSLDNPTMALTADEMNAVRRRRCDDQGGIGGISLGECRMFLTNAQFWEPYGTAEAVMIWLNLDSKHESRQTVPTLEGGRGEDPR